MHFNKHWVFSLVPDVQCGSNDENIWMNISGFGYTIYLYLIVAGSVGVLYRTKWSGILNSFKIWFQFTKSILLHTFTGKHNWP